MERTARICCALRSIQGAAIRSGLDHFKVLAPKWQSTVDFYARPVFATEDEEARRPHAASPLHGLNRKGNVHDLHSQTARAPRLHQIDYWVTTAMKHFGSRDVDGLQRPLRTSSDGYVSHGHPPTHFSLRATTPTPSPTKTLHQRLFTGDHGPRDAMRWSLRDPRRRRVGRAGAGSWFGKARPLPDKRSAKP